MTDRMRIKGLFFDLGGTLFRYAGRLGGGGLLHVLKTLGIEAQPEDIGRGWASATREAGEHFGAQPYFLHRDLFQATLQNFLRGFGHELDAELFAEFHRRQIDALLEYMPIRDDCHATLAALRERGLYLSIVSNIDDDYLDPIVARHGLDARLDDWTSSEAARSCKPDAGIYRFALEKSGLEASEVLFVGDSLQHDVAGADAIGMRSARIIEDGVTTPLTHGLAITAQPTYEIEALTQLLSIVDEANG
ncbi:MAG: HAD family hydrolase [Pseudomonadota bacterium]